MRLGGFIAGGLVGAALVIYLTKNKNMNEIFTGDSMSKMLDATFGGIKNIGLNTMGDSSSTWTN